ncbi:MAG: 4-hydroxythreonine-4-phosphate dehydrogenase PdxA [Planctomycetota bacterium]|nr:4-hydroxythreonine-4-phosphate dehydrogenase PdxA [Planctomycetota bacterium]
MRERRRDPVPFVALTLGDPAGIGPEVSLAALADERVGESMRLVVLGPGRFRPADVPAVDEGALDAALRVAWLDTGVEGEWTVGRPQASAGRAALRALRQGAELASEGLVDALVTAPVSKEALHLAGEEVEGQTELLARWAEVDRIQMLAVARRLRVALATRHLPLRRALEEITTERVVDHLQRLDSGLRSFGFAAPRLALAGLNPHAGESGLLGSEEAEILAPAVTRARDKGLDVTGPESPDTVFLRASEGAYDAVLALYHDQAFIPIKLHAPGEALTVLLGLPYLRVSPAHGTAFDIAGRGVADPANLICALLQAADWAKRR